MYSTRSECAPEYQQLYEEKLAQDHKFVDTSKVKYHWYYEKLFRFARKIPAHAIHTSSQTRIGLGSVNYPQKCKLNIHVENIPTQNK